VSSLSRTPKPGKRVQIDDATWHALARLAKDRMQDFQELADEAFADLLAKHGRPTDLKTALRRSVEERARSRLPLLSRVAAVVKQQATTTSDLRWACGPAGSTSRLAPPS
jgi:hypothetical protein